MKAHLAFGCALGLLAGSLSLLPACPGPAPATRPDVTYATPVPFEAIAPDGATACEIACEVLQRAGCPTFADCPAVLADIEKDRLERLLDGGFLTCAALAVAVRPQDLGLPCTP